MSCSECLDLEKYSHMRLDRCPYGDSKGFCAHCPTQCYGKLQKEQMKTVMKFSGPYMLFCHPLKFIQHIYGTLKLKKNKHFK